MSCQRKPLHSSNANRKRVIADITLFSGDSKRERHPWRSLSHSIDKKILEEGLGEFALFFEDDTSEQTRFQFEDTLQFTYNEKRYPQSIQRRRLYSCPQCMQEMPNQIVQIVWLECIEQQISTVKTAAIFVGKQHIHPWQKQEIHALLRQFAERDCRIIPVLLPGALRSPKLPLFLQGIQWVDFRQTAPDPLERLIWGITGRKHQAR